MNRYRLPTLLLAGSLATVAQAETTPYYIGASQSFTRDSNLLRLSDTQEPPAGFSKADTISSTSLLAGLDQPIGRQRVFGNVALRENRLSNNDVYNNQSYSLTAGADWETVEHISGNLKASANRSLAHFNTEQIGIVTKKNLETTQQVDASFRIGVVTAWTAEAIVGWRSVDYSAVEYKSREFSQNSISLGGRYRPRGATSLGVAVRDTKGKYPSFFPQADGSYTGDQFDRQDIDFTGYIEPSGASSVAARLSLGRTRYDLATQRDFSGVTGLLKWNWQPTGKLKFDTRLSRDPGQDSYFFDSAVSNATVDYSRLTTALRIRADYEATAKIGLNATIGYSRRSLARTLPAIPGVDSQLTGSDHSTNFGLGAIWVPLRSVTVGCDATRDQRRGELPLSSNLSDTTLSCYGQFQLQL